MLSWIKRLYEIDTAWLELTSAVLLVVWSLVLFLPPPTFETTPSYSAMAALFSEPVWASLAAFFAVAGLRGLVVEDRSLRRIALTGGVFFWGTVGACILLANHGATGGWVYLVLAHLCAVAYIARWR